MQFYQTLLPEKITDKFLWGRLEPLLGYLSSEHKSKVLEALHLAYDSHNGQVRACRASCLLGGLAAPSPSVTQPAAAEERRALHHAPGGGDAHPGGAEDGPREPDGGPAA